jgi:hypothetical protein
MSARMKAAGPCAVPRARSVRCATTPWPITYGSVPDASFTLAPGVVSIVSDGLNCGGLAQICVNNGECDFVKPPALIPGRFYRRFNSRLIQPTMWRFVCNVSTVVLFFWQNL